MTQHFRPHPKPVKAPKAKRTRDIPYLRKVRARPCIICVSFGMVQTSPTEAHHPICGRHGHLKSEDRNAIPVCVCHHRGGQHDTDKTKLAIHEGKASWVEAYGEDVDFIAVTQDAILGATP